MSRFSSLKILFAHTNADTAEESNQNKHDTSLSRLGKEVAKDMHMDPSKVEVVYDRNVTAAGVGKDGEVHVNPDVAARLTKQELKIMLAHELQHTRQPASMGPAEAERDADLAAARTYGPQAAVSYFQKLKIMFGPGGDAGGRMGDEHESIKDRQQAIVDAFPGKAKMPTVKITVKHQYSSSKVSSHPSM